MPFARRVALLPLLAIGLAGWSTLAPPVAPVAATPPSAVPVRPRTTPIATAGRSTLTTAVPLAPRPWPSVGRLDPARALTGASIVFRRSPAQEALSRVVLRDLENPLSPRYHRWLTPDDYAARFGATSADIARVSGWLASQGLTVVGPSRTGMRLFFSGTVDQVERAFQTKLHTYDVRGDLHFALGTAPSIPSELAHAVVGLRGLDDLHRMKRRQLRHGVGPHALLPVTTDDGGVSHALALAPADWAALYDVAPLYAQGFTGAGETIAIVGASDFLDGDIASFRAAYGLDPTNLPKRVLLPNSGNSTLGGDWYYEAELDLEWAGGIARDANLAFFYVGDNLAYGPWDAVVYAVDQGGFTVISASYGDAERTLATETQIDLIDAQTVGDAAAMEGITVVAASGDTGAGGYECGECMFGDIGYTVGWPASVPSVVAVGGTEFSWGEPLPEPLDTVPSPTYWPVSDAGYSATGYVPETSWNDYGLMGNDGLPAVGSSGGGASIVYPMPYWQVGQVPAGSFRLVPDVAFTASWTQVPYVTTITPTPGFEDAGSMLRANGGTSASTPSFAGLVAIVDQATGGGRFGNLNPLLYALHATTTGTAGAVFHDVTTGTNIVQCMQGTPDCPTTPPYQYGYAAGAGYDMVTGLGSMNAANFAAALETLTPTVTALQVSASGSTEGSMITLTATLASTATSNPLTGNVTFYLGAYDDGVTEVAPDLSVIASGPVQPTAMGQEGGTVTVTAIAPPGLTGNPSIAAFYTGDAHYRASWSPITHVTATSTLAISPSTLVLPVKQVTTLTATGGVPPVSWFTESCVYLEISSVTPNTASLNGGLEPCAAGTVYAIDSEGALAEIPIVVPMTVDAGVDAAVDDATIDAGVSDAGVDVGSPSNDAGTREAGVVDATLPRDASAPRDAGSPVHPVDAHVVTSPEHDAGDAAATPASGCSCTFAGAHGGERDTPVSVSLAVCVVGIVTRRRRVYPRALERYG